MILKQSIFLASWMFFLIFNTHAQDKNQQFTLSGYVKEKGSGELLPGVSIYAPKSEKGISTNNYGFYSLSLPASDSLEIIVSSFGYQTQKHILSFRKDIELNLSLSSDTVNLEEVVIEVEKYDKASDNAKISTVDIPIQQIKDIPALMGEKDVFKVLQLMPGVKKGTEGTSGFYVRGGGPDQNLIILDDATVYNANHLFGFFSIFNGDAIKSVELIKGGFPARYGGRLSSVVEMNMKEGNKEKIHGEAGIGLLSTRLTLEGPIKKGKSSFLISARRTYLDALMYPLMPSDEKAGYNFYDVNAKVNYDFGSKNKLYLSGYFGRDKFFTRELNNGDKYEAGLGWSNATGTLRWNHLFSNKVFANTSFIFSNYIFKIYENDKYDGNYFTAKYYSGIRDFTLKYDVDYLPGTKHSFRFGVSSIYHTFNPGALTSKDTETNESMDYIHTIHGVESGLYVEDNYKANSRLTINGGFRLSYFNTTGKNYLRPEPRISVGYKLKEDLAVKAGFSIMNQYLHLVSNTGIGLPTDLWVPATRRIIPQNSYQLAGGFVKDLIKQKATLTIEGYYKKTNHVLAYKEGASFLFGNDPTSSQLSWENNVTQGQGWAYGIEFLLQKKIGRFSGWIGYTLSWTQLQFDSINYGEKYYAKYDRRHDVSLVGIYKASEKITLSATWVYGTGNAITMPVSEYTLPAHTMNRNNGSYFYYNTVTEYGKRNSSRMPAYHRMDVAIQFHKYLKWGGKRTWELSVYNLYNRKNPFFYFTDRDYTGNGSYKVTLKQLTLFTIIPSISYQIKF
jgi:hypothetical protein